MQRVNRILAAVGAAVIAYFVAVFLYAVVAGVAQMPHGPLWDESFRGPLRFILIVLLCCALFIPAFRTEVDPATRGLAATSGAFLILYAFMKNFGLGQLADIPLHWVLARIEPIAHFFSGLAH